MTAKQRRFVNEYFKDFSPKQAALRAGYGKKWVAEYSRQPMSNPTVAKAIEERKAKLDARQVLTAQETLEGISAIASNEDLTAKDRLGAYRLMATYHDLLVERREVSQPGQFANMTDEELYREVRELLGEGAEFDLPGGVQ